MNYWDIENNFYEFSDPSRMMKIVYHYEIYKMILNLKGQIIECGVFKGNSLSRFLSFRKHLEQQRSRSIIGFDIFGFFPPQKKKEDNLFSIYHNKVAGKGIDKKNLEKILKNKGYSNFKLFKGDVNKTIPNFLNSNKNLKISLLHLDLDVYQPTLFVLNKLKNKIVKNGIILIDDYNIVDGATKAVNDFLADNKKLKIQKLKFLPNPSFIINK